MFSFFKPVLIIVKQVYQVNFSSTRKMYSFSSMDNGKSAWNVVIFDTVTYESRVLIIISWITEVLILDVLFCMYKIQVYNLNASILITIKIVLYLQDKYPPTALL